jgi:mRNA deadenylase 3'-5' endonuclease subunit Ccr4
LQFNSAYNLYNQLWPLETAYFVSFEGIKQAIAQQDSYKNARAKLQPLYTNYTETFKGTLDHLLHNECLLPLEMLEIPEEMKLKKEVALPSTLFPSDHVRIEATFVIM